MAAKSKPNWSKIGRSSKNRGKNYERKCANLLSEFTGVNFRKVPGSGGWNKQGCVVREGSFAGDIVSDRHDFRFCIESKNRPNDFNPINLLRNPETAKFSEWWFQCTEDAKGVGKLPMMFFKPRIRVDFVAFTIDGLNIIEYPENAPRIQFNVYHGLLNIRHPRRKQKIEIGLPIPYVVDWKTLIGLIKPERFFGELWGAAEPPAIKEG